MGAFTDMYLKYKTLIIIFYKEISLIYLVYDATHFSVLKLS